MLCIRCERCAISLTCASLPHPGGGIDANFTAHALRVGRNRRRRFRDNCMVAHRLVDLDVDVTTAKAASRGSQRPRRTMDRAVSRVSAVRHNSTAGAMYRFGVEARSTFGTRRSTVQIRAARLGKPISARTLAARCGSPEGACQSVLSSTRVTHSGDHTMARSPMARSPRAHWAMPHLESGWHATTKGEGHDGMTSRSQKEKTPSQLIDERIKELDDWRGQR